MDSAIVPGLHFDPYRDVADVRAKGCRVCRYFRGRTTGTIQGLEHLGGVHVVCERPDGGVIGDARHGCCQWEREPGAEDE